jgi:hypothetical protein
MPKIFRRAAAPSNEGAERGDDERVKDLTLDADTFPDATFLQEEKNLGRLKVTTLNGDTDGDGDFEEYGGKHRAEILAYCLMTNHIHLVAVPETEEGLQRMFKPVHRRCGQRISRARTAGPWTRARK